MSISLGCDPEFGFLETDTHNVVPAHDIISQGWRGKFGTDGHSEIAEIRPTHSDDPRELVKNIEQAFKYGIKRYPDLKNLTWKAGSMIGNNPIGGHIHFGTYHSQSLTKMLDCFLAVPALLLEKRSEAVARRDHGYGNLGNIRNKSWGFEYRVLGSWLTSPKIATSILCLAKTIVEEWSIRAVNTREFQPNSVAFNKVSFDVLLPKMEATYNRIKQMRAYSAYVKEIDFIFKLIEHNKTWFPENGMKQAWGIEAALILKELPQVHTNEVWSKKRVNIY